MLTVLAYYLFFADNLLLTHNITTFLTTWKIPENHVMTSEELTLLETTGDVPVDVI